MPGPKNHNDKSLHGLSVGLGIAGTIAATVIVFAYAAGDGFLYPAPELPSADTAAAATGPALPADDIKQELQLAQDKMQDGVRLADKIVTERQQVQQTREDVEMQESVDIDKVDYVPAVEDRADEPSSPAKHDEAQDPAPPANNDNELPPPLPTLPPLEEGADDHHNKGEPKEHKGKKHDSIASVAFKGKHHKGD